MAAAIKLSVKVVPGSSRNSVDGWLGDTLKVRVTAPPERGKANVAVEQLLARTLGISKSRVHVVSGHGSTRKVMELSDLSEPEVLARLPGNTG